LDRVSAATRRQLAAIPATTFAPNEAEKEVVAMTSESRGTTPPVKTEHQKQQQQEYGERELGTTNSNVLRYGRGEIIFFIKCLYNIFILKFL
jgi:hypothetical protein